MRSLIDQIAVITGGTTGIGLAITEVFLRSGARVLINDLDDSRFEQVKSKLLASGSDPSYFDFFPLMFQLISK